MTSIGSRAYDIIAAVLQELKTCDLPSEESSDVRRLCNYVSTFDMPMVKQRIWKTLEPHKGAMATFISKRDVSGMTAYVEGNTESGLFMRYSNRVMSVVEKLNADEASKCWAHFDELAVVMNNA